MVFKFHMGHIMEFNDRVSTILGQLKKPYNDDILVTVFILNYSNKNLIAFSKKINYIHLMYEIFAIFFNYLLCDFTFLLLLSYRGVTINFCLLKLLCNISVICT